MSRCSEVRYFAARKSRSVRAEERPFGMTRILGIGMSRRSEVRHFAATCICANRIEHLPFRRVSEAREEESAGRRHGSWVCVVPGRRKSRFLRAEERPFGMTMLMSLRRRCGAFPKWES
jgi:hypothetical protein